MGRFIIEVMGQLNRKGIWKGNKLNYRNKLINKNSSISMKKRKRKSLRKAKKMKNKYRKVSWMTELIKPWWRIWRKVSKHQNSHLSTPTKPIIQISLMIRTQSEE
jgi:phosphorylcholine metabolism protein LicD